MKKSVLIIIGIIYIASIVAINFFGMRVSVYNQTIDVNQIVCLNKTDDEKEIVVSTFTSLDGTIGTAITLPFDKPANKNLLTGTMLQLDIRVYPDNASNKKLSYSASGNENIEFDTDKDTGFQTGLILFYDSTSVFDVIIRSTDNTNVSLRIKVKAYQR